MIYASDEGYRPPAPIPRNVDLRNTKTTARGLWNYFKIMTSNPLHIWCEDHFNEVVFPQKVLGRKFLFVHDPEFIRYYMVSNASNYGLTYIRKAMFEPILGNGLFVAEGQDWRSTRRALTPIFTPRHVCGLAAIMRDVTRHRASELACRQERFSLCDEMLRLTLDILIATLFSNNMTLESDRFSQHIDRLLEIAGVPHPMDLAQMPNWVPRFGRKEARRLIADIRNYLMSLVKVRRDGLLLSNVKENINPYTDKINNVDFLTLLLRAKGEDERSLSDDEIVDNLLTFLAAGHETTARSMMWLFYILTQQKELCDQLQQEIKDADLDDNAPAEWGEHLPLAIATIKEVMRLYPAAGIINRVALGSDKIGNENIEAGTEIITAPWLLHRHRSIWKNPDLFNPARFLGERAKTVSKGAYIPYGIGPRVCIGARFAQQEMVIILVEFLRVMKLKFSDDQHPEPVLRITVQPSTQLMVEALKF